MSYSSIGTSLFIDTLGRPQLLIVNTDPLTRELYTHLLNLEGYDVETESDGADTLESLEMGDRPAVQQSSGLEQND
jgi:DNA-binding NtrC family response regulator